MSHKAVLELDREASIYGQSRDWIPTIELESNVGIFFQRIDGIKEKLKKVRFAQECEGKTRLRLTQKLDMIEQLLEKADACFLDDEAMA